MDWALSIGLLLHEYLCIIAMKISWIVLLLASLMAACSGEGLSPERKACLENAKTEAERIACNNAAAIRSDREAQSE